jgi:glycosyltransferase involved in cell wall biosynthesis
MQIALDTLRGYGRLSRHEIRSVFGKAARRRPAVRKNVLLLAPFLPPFDNGGVHRPLAWLQYASGNGWKTFAISRPFTGAASVLGTYLQGRMPPETSVSYMEELAIRPSWSLFPRTDGTFLGALGSIPLGETLIRRNDIAAVVATGPSFDFFVSAFYLAKSHNLPLVLDYRDEWTENPFATVQCGNSDRFWEARCLKAADLVTFTSKRMMAHNQRAFPGLLDDKARILRNGWEPQDLEAARETVARTPEKRGGGLTIMFAGTMGDATLPGEFLNDLTVLCAEGAAWRDRLLLHVIGTRVPEAEAQLAAFAHRSHVAVEGIFPKNIANALLRESDAVLLLTPDAMARYIPGKLFEYLASGKPVLVYGTAGEAAEIVTELGAGEFVPAGDSAALHKTLEALRTSPTERWNTPRRRRWVEDHTREALARQFYGMLDALVG